MDARLTFLSAGLLLAPLLAFAADPVIVLPSEPNTLPAGPGADLAAAHCLVCHSSEYLSTQPPMPRKFWETEVKKMREKFGAPTPDEAIARLVDYLAGNFGLPSSQAK